MPHRRYPLAAVAGLALLFSVCLSAETRRIAVEAADVDRAGVVATFRVAEGKPRYGLARDAAGAALPVQIDRAGLATFVIPVLKAGDAPTFAFEEVSDPDHHATVGVLPGRLALKIGGKAVFNYWTGERPFPRAGIDPLYRRGGFIHPVRTPAGVEVTASYPPNHLHHHGIWSPWTKTKFQGRTPDFWNMGKGQGTVEVVPPAEPAASGPVWAGPVHAGFVSNHRFVDLSAPSPVVALNETWKVTVYHVPGAPRPVHVFDLELSQECATEDPLILPEYHYGGLGFRGHDQWEGAANAAFLTSEGETDRVKAHATRARWCHVGGRVDGALAGVAILGHPDNFRAPQPMRIHPKEPFFCFVPSQLGDWQIEPGQPYVARYRFVVMDGEPDAALIDAFWNGYAKPGVATLSSQ